jgi:mono/diheme cytochrome c family protein
MRISPFSLICLLATMILGAALVAGCAARRMGAPDVAAAPPAAPAGESLVAQGRARFIAYKCHECHGVHGEGTDDAPDLTGTLLNADQIALFLQKPSVHARSVGMPSIPSDSPDLQPLVAFVFSLKRMKPS